MPREGEGDQEGRQEGRQEGDQEGNQEGDPGAAMPRGDPTPAEGAIGTHYDAAARLEYFARRFGPNHLPALAQAYPVPPRTQAGTLLSPYFLSAQSCETDFSYACASIRLPLPLALPLPLPLTKARALVCNAVCAVLGALPGVEAVRYATFLLRFSRTSKVGLTLTLTLTLTSTPKP